MKQIAPATTQFEQPASPVPTLVVTPTPDVLEHFTAEEIRQYEEDRRIDEYMKLPEGGGYWQARNPLTGPVRVNFGPGWIGRYAVHVGKVLVAAIVWLPIGFVIVSQPGEFLRAFWPYAAIFGLIYTLVRRAARKMDQGA